MTKAKCNEIIYELYEKLKELSNVRLVYFQNEPKSVGYEMLPLYELNVVIDVKIINKETKISYNKVLVKADASVKIMYRTEDNRICTTSNLIPIMGFIDMPDVTDESMCNVKDGVTANNLLETIKYIIKFNKKIKRVKNEK